MAIVTELVEFAAASATTRERDRTHDRLSPGPARAAPTDEGSTPFPTPPLQGKLEQYPLEPSSMNNHPSHTVPRRACRRRTAHRRPARHVSQRELRTSSVIEPRFPERPRIAVFAPTPLLTITVEAGGDPADIHLHAGGQGIWVARMAATLGADVELCAPLGGESGHVLRELIASEGPALRASCSQRANGVYIHDRRSGTRVEVATSLARPLRRHELDELYGITLTTALCADAVLLTGPQPPEAVDARLYRRLTHDLRDNGKLVIADLTGSVLSATLQAGIDLVKISVEELIAEGYARSDALPHLVDGMQRLQQAGALSVVLSRAAAPTLALTGSAEPRRLIEVRGPQFEELDHHGAGDCMFAGLGVALANGLAMTDALRLATAAGALNVTRHGLGSGTRAEIERLAQFVDVRPCLPPE
jgi:1-phosphofructokinase